MENKVLILCTSEKMQGSGLAGHTIANVAETSLWMFLPLSCCLNDNVTLHMPVLVIAEDPRTFACDRLHASIEVIARRTKTNKRCVQTLAALAISQSAQVTRGNR